MQLLLLDRDGVINEDRTDYVKSIDELKILPEAIEAIALAKQHGFHIAVATNQSCINKGIITAEQVNDIHNAIQQALAAKNTKIDAFYICPDAVASANRKPAAGMLLQALADFAAIPEKTWFIGDALRDLQAAETARCVPILVATGKGKQTYAAGNLPENTQYYDNILVAVQQLLQQ